MVTKLDVGGVILVFDPGYLLGLGTKGSSPHIERTAHMSKLLLWYHGRKVSYAVKLEQNRISFLPYHAFDILHLIFFSVCTCRTHAGRGDDSKRMHLLWIKRMRFQSHLHFLHVCTA
jgi:hypothetical protein